SRSRVRGSVAGGCLSGRAFRFIDLRASGFFRAQVCGSSLPCCPRSPDAYQGHTCDGPHRRKAWTTGAPEALADSAGISRTESKDGTVLLVFLAVVGDDEVWCAK